MGLITTVISIATEESTPVGLTVVSKDGTSGEQFGLTVTTTSRTATTENRQVSWATVGHCGKYCGRDRHMGP